MHRLHSYLCLAVLLFHGSQVSYGQASSDVMASVVKIVYSCQSLNKAKTGTGFVWKKKNQVVTALHLVTGDCSSENVYVYLPTNTDFSQGRYYKAKIVKVLKTADLALLEVADLPSTLKPLTNQSNTITFKQTVYALGYPIALPSKRSIELKIPYNESKKLRDNLTSPLVEQLKQIGFNSDIDVVHFQGPLLPGLSGAPIVNDQGNVIAIGNGGLQKGTIDISWGIPSARINELEISDELIVLDPLHKKSNDLLFASEITFSLQSLGENFFQVEKLALEKNMIKTADLAFYKIDSKPFSQIRQSSDDQQGLLQLSGNFRVNDKEYVFDIYKNFETGAVLVLPAGAKVRVMGTDIVSQSIDKRFTIRFSPFRLRKSYDITEELCTNSRTVMPVDSGYFWIKDMQSSYTAPTFRFDGQTVNREAYVKSYYDGVSSTPKPTSYLFMTTAKKNNLIFFISVTDASHNLDYRQNLIQCLQGTGESEGCQLLLEQFKEWGRMVLSVHLSSFAI